ncbi:MAG: ABC transporter substrate-binding protein [Acetivibrio ethanolgignens]
MKKRALALVLTVAMAATMLVGCGSGNQGAAPAETQAAAEPSESGTPAREAGVLYSNGGPTEFFETPWLNPGVFIYNKALYGHLLFADENLSPIAGEGDLATSYEMAEDGSTLTFTLRDGITWHDGESITAEEIQWNIEYSLKTTVLNSVFRSTFEAIEGADKYAAGEAEHISGIAVDGNKITLTFSKVAPDALLTFTQFAPLPKKHLEDIDPVSLQQASYFQSPIGSGPFKVEEVQMGSYTILAPFENYYGGTASYKIHLNPSAGDSDPNFVTNVKAGQLDYAYTKNIADIQALEGVAGITIDKVDVRYTRLLYVNKFNRADGSKSPLADPKVRQAIAYAIDMQAICDGVMNGSGVPANSLTPDGADKVDGLNNYDYNPEKAKSLLAEAGWDSNTELKVVYYYTDQATQDLMAVLQQYLAEVGVKMNATLVEGDLATILWKAPEDPVNGPSAVDWDMCYAANAALSMHEYYDRYQTGYSINSHTPGDAELDKLIAATNASVDPEVQKQEFFEIQKYENENLFVIPLYYQPIYLVHSDRVSGIEKVGNPQFNYNWNIQNWTVK